jgi:hypothetical protein
LKSNLEILRQKLVSPLVRSTNSSTISVATQMKGLEATYAGLKRSRDEQKVKVRELVYGARPKHHDVGAKPVAIEAT